MTGLFSINDHVIVCGFGSTGELVAKDLAEQGVGVVVIDKSAEAASLAEEHGHQPLHGDVLDPDVLQEAGIDRARGVILLLPSESDNLFATMTARELNPDIFIIAERLQQRTRAQNFHDGSECRPADVRQRGPGDATHNHRFHSIKSESGIHCPDASTAEPLQVIFT